MLTFFLRKYKGIAELFPYLKMTLVSLHSKKSYSNKMGWLRACLKNHSYNLHTLICGIFCPHSVDVARYAALIRTKSPTNYDVHLVESIFQTRSSK